MVLWEESVGVIGWQKEALRMMMSNSPVLREVSKRALSEVVLVRDAK